MSGGKAYVKPVDKQVTILEENESSMQGQKHEIPIAKEVQEMMDMMQGHWVSKCICCVIFAYCEFILWTMLISKPFAILYVITRCIWQFYIRLTSFGKIDSSQPEIREILHFAEKLIIPYMKKHYIIRYPIHCWFPKKVDNIKKLMKRRVLSFCLPVLLMFFVFNNEPFGSATLIMIVTSMIIYILNQFIDRPLFWGNLLSFVIPAGKIIWKIKIKTYFEMIRENLSSLDLQNEEEKKKVLTKLQEEHDKVQNYAFIVNRKLSTFNGLVIALCGAVALELLALALVWPKPGINIWQRIYVSMFVLIMMRGSLDNVKIGIYDIARMNLLWEKEALTTLHDPTIQYKMEQVLGVNYMTWLSRHELAAQRVFGVKFTTTRASHVISFLSSAFATAVLYIISQNVDFNVVMEWLY